MTVLDAPRRDKAAAAPHAVERWIRTARIVHPFPTLLNMVATAGLALVAADGSPDGSTLARMMIAMLFAQCAIGVTNDIFDRELDGATKPWKPVASGLVSNRVATALAIAFAASAFVAAATLGGGSLGLFALGTACGLAYDVRLKRGVFSGVPYMIAIPTLPIWVYVTVGAWDDVLFWLLPLGALIGLALHLANTLPDIEDDAAHGVRGLAHRLGISRSLGVCWASFGAALVLVAALSAVIVYDPVWLAVTLSTGVISLLLTVGAWIAARRRALAFNFGAISIGAAVTAAGWLAAVT